MLVSDYHCEFIVSAQRSVYSWGKSLSSFNDFFFILQKFIEYQYSITPTFTNEKLNNLVLNNIVPQ